MKRIALTLICLLFIFITVSCEATDTSVIPSNTEAEDSSDIPPTLR